MKTIDDKPTPLLHAFRLVGHPSETVPADGSYQCLCCGVMLWHVRKGRRFPDCPSADCPTMWLWVAR